MSLLDTKHVEPYTGNIRVLRSGVWIREGERYVVRYDKDKEHVGVCCFDKKSREIGWWVKHRILHEFINVYDLRITYVKEIS